MARFQVVTEKEKGRTVVELKDAEHMTAARIACDYGFNCMSFTKRFPDGPGEFIYAHESFPGPGQGGAGNGIPILFPFPNRIKGGRFTFEGREVALPRNEGGRNAIHGLILDKPFQILTTQVEDGASVTGRIDTETIPELRKNWPFPFTLEVTYRLRGDTLAFAAAMRNSGPTTLPCGLGTHGYFMVPGSPTIDSVSLAAPVRKRWVLQDLIPTGQLVDLPAEDAEIARGLAIGSRRFDTVYGGIVYAGDWATCRLENERRFFELRFDRSQHVLVIYTPPNRRSIALEPYTCPTDAFNLAARGVETGASFLKPGQEAKAAMEMRVGERR